MLAISSTMIILMTCSIIVAYRTFWLKHELLFNNPKDYLGSYLTEILLYFPYRDKNCNFSSICFILGGFIFTFIERIFIIFAWILTITA